MSLKINALPDDLLLSVFEKLSVQSLVRFRATSKFIMDWVECHRFDLGNRRKCCVSVYFDLYDDQLIAKTNFIIDGRYWGQKLLNSPFVQLSGLSLNVLCVTDFTASVSEEIQTNMLHLFRKWKPCMRTLALHPKATSSIENAFNMLNFCSCENLRFISTEDFSFSRFISEDAVKKTKRVYVEKPCWDDVPVDKFSAILQRYQYLYISNNRYHDGAHFYTKVLPNLVKETFLSKNENPWFQFFCSSEGPYYDPQDLSPHLRLVWRKTLKEEENDKTIHAMWKDERMIIVICIGQPMSQQWSIISVRNDKMTLKENLEKEEKISDAMLDFLFGLQQQKRPYEPLNIDCYNAIVDDLTCNHTKTVHRVSLGCFLLTNIYVPNRSHSQCGIAMSPENLIQDNKTLCRFRRTCKKMNEYVEYRRWQISTFSHKFSSFIYDTSGVQIYTDKEGLCRFSASNHWKYIHLFDPFKQLSAIRFSEIVLYYNKQNINFRNMTVENVHFVQKFKEIVELLAKLRLRCKRLLVYLESEQDDLEKVVDCITSSEINIIHRSSKKLSLRQLLSSCGLQNRHQFGLEIGSNCSFNIPEDGVLKYIKSVKSIYLGVAYNFDFGLHFIKLIIKEILDSDNIGNLNNVHVKFFELCDPSVFLNRFYLVKRAVDQTKKDLIKHEVLVQKTRSHYVFLSSRSYTPRANNLLNLPNMQFLDIHFSRKNVVELEKLIRNNCGAVKRKFITHIVRMIHSCASQ